MAVSKYTKEYLEESVKTVTSYNGLLKVLGLQLTGGNQSYIRNKIKEHAVDVKHFTGRGWNTGSRSIAGTKKFPIEDYLSNRRFIHSHKLKLRLIAEGLKEAKCELCGIVDWLGAPLPLELDHINSIHSDNTLSNLQILCPNCHSQKTRSSLYGSKN